MRTLKRQLAALVIALGLGGTAAAVPLVYTVLPTSSLTGDINGTLSVTVYSNVGTFNGSGAVSGALSSTPTGTITADWGSPGWDNSVTITDVSIDNPNPGSVTGNVGITIGILGLQNFDLAIDVDNISLGLDSPATTVPLPSEVNPGAGPWTAIFPSADLLLGATASGSASGLVDIDIAPFSFGSEDPISVPLAGSLSRLFSGPTEVGTGLIVPIPGIDLVVPPGAPVNQPAPGCELTIFGCVVNVTSVDLQITSLSFENVTGMIYAENLAAVIPTPEPTMALLTAAGMLGLLAIARRRRS